MPRFRDVCGRFLGDAEDFAAGEPLQEGGQGAAQLFVCLIASPYAASVLFSVGTSGEDH